MTDQFEKNY